MIKRELLITTVKNLNTGHSYEIAGRYDVVALAHAGYTVEKSEFRKYECKESDFIKIAKEV